MLGAVVQRPDSGGVVLTGWLSVAAEPWLADHAVAGVVLFPGAGFVELVLRAGDEVGCSVVEELTLLAPLVLPSADGVQVQVVVDAPGQFGFSGRVGVFAWCAADSVWVLHAEGVLSAKEPAAGRGFVGLAAGGATAVDVADAYERLADRGYEYGPAFRGLQAMWQRGNEVFAEVTVRRGRRRSRAAFGIHPGVLDAALHAMGVAGEQARDDVAVFLAGSLFACCGGVAGAGPDSACGCWRRCRWTWPTVRVCRSCRCASWWFARVSVAQLSAACGGGRRGGGGSVRGGVVAGVVGAHWYWR